MSKKSKPTLIVAGPGAGKTTAISTKVIEKLPTLSSNRYMVIITYTNAAADEIEERLSQKSDLPPNIFIGTIHSFLIKFILNPYAKILNYMPEEVVYKGIDFSSSDWKIKNVLQSQLIKKGIVSYDKIISLSNEIIKIKGIRELISNRIDYLFIDEFQDASIGQFNIFEEIRKARTTEIFYVGDPEQSIMSFQSRGKKTPTMNNRPIFKLINNRAIEKVYLNENNRSSETIIKFLNNFHTSITQQYENKKIISKNKVVFLNESNLHNIIEEFRLLCEDKSYCEIIPRERFYLAYERKTFRNVAPQYGISEKSVKPNKNINLLKESTAFISELLNRSKNLIMDDMAIDILEFRRLNLKIIQIIRETPNLNSDDLISIVKSLFFGVSSQYISEYVKDNSNQIADDFINRVRLTLDSDKNFERREFYLTIHKAKGLQASAVLIVAKTNKELEKWLLTDKKKREEDKRDVCRIGYVGFSRAKEFLCIACLEPVEENLLKKLRDFNVITY